MPDFKDYVRGKLPPLGIPAAREAEIVEELALELEQSYERALRGGLQPEQAWREVTSHARAWDKLGEELRLALGGTQAEPREPAARTNAAARFAEELRRDLGYGLRQLNKSRGFTVAAVLMLALGIGANTSIFSLLNAILLRRLPVREPQQLVFFGKAEPEGSTPFLPNRSTEIFSYPFYREFRRKNQVFSEVAAIQSFLAPSHGRVAGQAEMEPLNVELVSGTYFNTLGVTARLGRVFTEADDRIPGGHPIAVASYGWWRNRLGGDPSIAGKTVSIGPATYTIVGVAAPEFSGVSVGQSPNLWIPLSMQRQICPDESGLDDNLFQSLHLIARLKPGVSRRQAEADTDLLFHQIVRSYLGPQPSQLELREIQHARVELVPALTGRSKLRREFGAPLKILMGVVVLVLLIVSANVANLLLARATAREREIAVRLSLGAPQGRLVRQLFAESGLLGLAGAALGVAGAWSAGGLLVSMVSSGPEPVPIQVAPDGGVLGFTTAVTILTVLVFGTAPALRATRPNLVSSLGAGRGWAAGGARNRLARALVAGQVALSVVLLTAAGLFLRSLANLTAVDVGFDRQNVIRLRIDAVAAGYQRDGRLNATMQSVEERVSALPGVHAASFAYSVFDGGGWSETDVVARGGQNIEKNPSVELNVVGPRYFEVMRIPLVMGRPLSYRDNAASRKVAVINETMAQTHFPGGSPLSREFSVGDEPDWQNIEVVGVVKDAKYMRIEEKQMPAAFFPEAQNRTYLLRNLVVRYTGETGSMIAAIRRSVGEIDRNLPVGDARTLVEMVDDFTRNQRVVAQLASLFGGLAALLACIGVYSVMSYGITRRTNEFGIRMALGAERRDVVWVVLRETLGLAIGGAAIGVVLALAAGLVVESLLFGVKPGNTAVMGLAAAGMIAVALAGAYGPARRATRIDPATALRHE